MFALPLIKIRIVPCFFLSGNVNEGDGIVSRELLRV